MSFSGLKDIDREIFSKLGDRYLLKVSSVDKNTWYKTCDDNFLKRRLQKYPEIENYKRDGENWKTFFSRFVYYKLKMREKRYVYRFGNFQTQWEILNQSNSKSLIFRHSVAKGEIALIQWCINFFRKNKHYMQNYDNCLVSANDVKTVKYLFGEGFKYDFKHLAYKAIENEDLELLKYYSELNVLNKDICNSSLLKACIQNNLEIVKYLVEKGASDFNNALWTSVNGDLEIVKYLLQCGANNFNDALIEATKNIYAYSEETRNYYTKKRIKIIDCLLENEVDLIHVLNNIDPYNKCKEIEDYLKSKLSFKDKIKFKFKNNSK